MFDIDLSNLKAVNQKDFILKQSQEYREKTDYNAFYMAVVINSNDPEELGRVQIRIPALHGTRKNQNYFIEDSELPWARPGIFATGGNDMGQFLVPQKGNRVFVTFEFNNPSNPIYFGGIPTLIGKTPKQYNDNPDIYNGNTVEITDNDKIKSKSKSKANQIVYPAGSPRWPPRPPCGRGRTRRCGWPRTAAALSSRAAALRPCFYGPTDSLIP